MLEQIYLDADKISKENKQTIEIPNTLQMSENHARDYYITLKQLEDILMVFES